MVSCPFSVLASLQVEGVRSFLSRFRTIGLTANAKASRISCRGVIVAGCQREERQLRLDPPVTAALNDAALMPNGISGAPPQIYFALDKPYEGNAYNLSQGKRLYSWFGCKACHADGQGGIGPAFLDGWWYYGPEIVSIFASIRDGRPHECLPFATR
jgi:mono/diheme cytochrome c family protein